MPSNRFATAVLHATVAGFLLVAPTSSNAVTDYVVQWESPGTGVDGFRLYVGNASHSYANPIDLGLVTPDVDGVRRYPVVLDETVDNFLAMSAYNAAGESNLSNEVVVAAAPVCDPSACDDANPCTADTCSGTSCIHSPLPDGSLCSAQGSVCEAGQCRAVECLADVDCSDGDACNGAEACSAGTCVAGPAPSCGSPTACSSPSCDPTFGCTQVAVADGTACDDGLSSTFGDACLSGVCQGTPVDTTTTDSGGTVTDTGTTTTDTGTTTTDTGTTTTDTGTTTTDTGTTTTDTGTTTTDTGTTTTDTGTTTTDTGTTTTDTGTTTVTALVLKSLEPGNVTVGTYELRVIGQGFVAGAQAEFVNGSGPVPVVVSTRLVDGQTLSLVVDIQRSRSRWTRAWDLVVTLPDGRQAALQDALYVIPEKKTRSRSR